MQSFPASDDNLTLFSFREIEDHLRFAEDEDQADAVAKMRAAVRFCEEYTHRKFLTSTRRLTLRRFPSCREIQLDCPPWQSVSSIAYLDINGDSQTLATSAYGFDSDRGLIYLKKDQLWPCTYDEPLAVTITYLAGWTSKDLVPEDIRQAVLFMLGHNYVNREAVINGSISAEVKMTVEAYLAPWVVPRY